MIKGNPLNFKDKSLLHPLLRNENKLSLLDYRNRCRQNVLVPINFLNKIIFVNKDSFIQNNKKIGDKIRKYVLDNIDISNNSIISIGGESYNYLYFFSNIQGTFYTNNKLILTDFYYNNKIYNNKNYGKLINYNKDNIISGDICIINLSKLNKILLEKINNKKFKKIIIINCHHKDFWKKIKLLNNYKLNNRTRFIDKKIGYFISVTILSLTF